MKNLLLMRVIRDMMTNEIPIIFHKEIYATACFFGALLYLVLNNFGIDHDWNLVLSGSLIVINRCLAVYFNWSLPKFRVAK